MIRLKRSTASVIAWNLLGILVALGLAELVLRKVHTPAALQSRLTMNKLMRQGPVQAEGLFDTAAFRFKPNSSGQQLHNEYQHKVSHDRHGWRNPCFDERRPATAVFIGDSYTYGIGVGDSDLLQCRLQQIDPSLNIYALGLPGANIGQYLEILKRNKATINHLKQDGTPVDLVLCMGNDYEGLLSFGATERSLPTSTSTPALQPHGFKAQLSQLNGQLMQIPWIADIHLLQAIKLMAMQNSRIKDHGDYFSNYGGQTFYKRGAPQQRQQLERALVRLRERFEAEGVNLGSIFLIPDGSEISKERLQRDGQLGGFTPDDVDVAHKFKALLGACRSAAIRCVDLRPELSSEDYYVYDGHFRPSGVEVVARTVAKELQQRP